MENTKEKMASSGLITPGNMLTVVESNQPLT
jgi:hypothetical protein